MKSKLHINIFAGNHADMFVTPDRCFVPVAVLSEQITHKYHRFSSEFISFSVSFMQAHAHCSSHLFSSSLNALFKAKNFTIFCVQSVQFYFNSYHGTLILFSLLNFSP